MMSSALDHIRVFLCFGPLNLYSNGNSRTNMRIFAKTALKLPATKRKNEQVFQKGMMRSQFSSYSECHPKLELAECHDVSTPTAKAHSEVDESEDIGLRNGIGNSGNTDDRNGNGISGSGNGDSNNNGNDNNGGYGADEGSEHNHEEEVLLGVEWWWWWKWQQVRHSRQAYDNMFDLWPVDTAVQVVAIGVKETIKPAVRAIVLAPITQHVTMQGLLLLLVFGAFVISFVQLVAGLAMVSTGVSLAGVAMLLLAVILRPWKLRPSQGQGNDGGDHNGDES